MIEFKLKSFKVCFHFSFFAIVAVLMLLKDFKISLFGLYACIIHELGHLLVMRCFRINIRSVEFYCAGIKISLKKGNFYPVKKELMMLFGGCAVNFIAALICFAFSEHSENIFMFGLANASICVFNLLPLSAFDGGKILVLLTEKNSRTHDLFFNLKILRFFSIFIAVILLYLLVKMNFSNPTVYITLIYFIFAEAFVQNG